MGVPGTDLDGLRGLRRRGARREYWFWLAVLIWASWQSEDLPGYLTQWAISLAMVALIVRRLHDLGISGWWILGGFVGQIVVQGIAGALVDPILAETLAVVAGALAALVLGVVPGQRTTNRFGSAFVWRGWRALFS